MCEAHDSVSLCNYVSGCSAEIGKNVLWFIVVACYSSRCDVMCCAQLVGFATVSDCQTVVSDVVGKCWTSLQAVRSASIGPKPTVHVRYCKSLVTVAWLVI